MDTLLGPSGAIIIVLALAAALLLILVATFGSLSGVTRTVARVFWCPFRAQNVTAEFQEEAWDGKPVEVKSCSAFSPPTAVTCQKLCLHLRKFRPVRKARRATWAA